MTRYIRRAESDRFCQGDLIRDFQVVEWAGEDAEGQIEIKNRVLPYAVILTQDCDLEQDFNCRQNHDAQNDDKHLQSILLCPAYPAQEFRAGEHLRQLGFSMHRFDSKMWKTLKANNNYRYHFLSDNLDLQVPELVLDFKHYFTAPRDMLYEAARAKSYLASLGQLFREDLSNRFAYYLSRIGLPIVA